MSSAMNEGEDGFGLIERLLYSGPRKHDYDSGPQSYYCTYCLSALWLLPHEIRVCQSRNCIEKAIEDRKERIWQIQLSIPRVHKQLLEQKGELSRTIEELQKQNPNSERIGVNRSLLASLERNLFFAKNDREDRILALEEQITELSRRLSRPSFSDSFRRGLWERDGGVCYLCHKPIPNWDGDNMHLDHVTPRSKGGSDAAYNLRIAHPACNLQKSDGELSARRMKAILRELRKSEDEIAKERLF